MKTGNLVSHSKNTPVTDLLKEDFIPTHTKLLTKHL